MTADDVALTRVPAVHTRRLINSLWVWGWILLSTPAFAQTDRAADPGSVSGATTDAPPVTLTYNNRSITELRASIFSRPPSDRATAAVHFLDQLVESGSVRPVTARMVGENLIVSVAGRDAFGILPGDLDTLADETLPQKGAAAATRLQTALDEAVELRTPGRLLRSGAAALLGTLIFVGLLWLLRRGHARADQRLTRIADRQFERFPGANVIRATRLLDLMHYGVTFVSVVLGMLLAYAWLTFVLRRFPYTRPWGESLRELLLGRAGQLGRGMVDAIPDLVTVLLIVLVTRFAVRLSNLAFEAAEHGTLKLPWVYPETAQPTRRLVTGLLWVFALTMAYPYLPGSQTDAFKGISVFVGLMISLGSSGIVNQVMSGLTLTYSRALLVGTS